MKFTYSLISDMHVNHPQLKTPYDKLEEFVIVAGDTSDGLEGLKFINKLKNKGHKVFAVDGNHEHYSNDSKGRTIAETEAAFYAGLQQPRAVLISDNLAIVGCNGWYHVVDDPLWRSHMNDCLVGSATEVNACAARHANYLSDFLRDFEGQVIVVTHTAPCLETLNPTYDGHFSNDWYWNPFMYDILQRNVDKILVWNHGHTHAPADKIIHGVRVIANPRGYPREIPGWAPLTVEVG
jgi:DNA repair exonuclease SbcCD nuclease subunit